MGEGLIKVTEIENETRFGLNVKVTNFWGRHASKQSAAIATENGQQISNSSITKAGAEAAKRLGTTFTSSKDGVKPYVSSSPRAGETADNILFGYQAENPGVPIRDRTVSGFLSPDVVPSQFLSLYNQKFLQSRNNLMEQRGQDPADYDNLSLEEQEEIAERSEEPVMAEWINQEQGEGHNQLQELFPLDDATANFANFFNRHNSRIVEKLYNGSEVDLVHISHRLIMEPFITSGILIRSKDGKRITDLDEAGGAIAILEGWQSVASTDDQGKKNIKVILRGEEYRVDQELLEKYTREYLEREKAKSQNNEGSQIKS